MPSQEPAHRSRPVQVAKRKQKPLGREEIVVRKRSKTAKAVTFEDDEAANASDDQEGLKIFISPEKYLGKTGIGGGNEELRVFVSPLKYMYAANEDDERPRGRRESHVKGKGDTGSSSRPSDDKAGSTQHLPRVEKSTESAADRFVTTAQEDLMQMIDEGASDKAIDNQMKIIKLLRARLPSQGESIFSPGGLSC
jgi:hypothetical protein